jgi:hypothetical protein
LPEWAYPVNPTPTPLDDTVQKHLADSTKAYTQAQIDDGFNPPDWYAQDHPPMPDVVAHGRKAANECPGLRLVSPHQRRGTTGIRAHRRTQLNDIKIGTRNGAMVPLMKGVVEKLTDGDMIAVAAYLVSRGP